jgi:hypothetical protein
VRMFKRFFMAAGALALVMGVLMLPSSVPRAAAQSGTNLIPTQTSDLATSGSTGLWDAWYGDTIAQSTAEVFTGDTGSLAITATEANDVGVNWSDYPGVSGVEASTPYTLSYAVYGPSGTTFTMDFEWFNSSETLLATSSLDATTDGGWVNPSENVTTPAGASTLFVEFTSTNATDGTTYYLDSIDAVGGGSGGGGGGSNCTDPVWTDSASNTDNTDTYSGDSPYIDAMDMWNATASPISQTMDVCSAASWYVDDTTTSTTNTAVLVYPNVQENFSSDVSSYSAINSSYAANSTSGGDYEFAYDIWLNGFGSGSNEVMIWTQNHGQTPGGSLVASDVTVDGLTWDVYASSDNSYIAFVPYNGASYPSGAFSLLDFFNYLMGTGQIATTSTLTQIDYGVEICNTDGVQGQFNFTNFSISTSS